MLLTRDYCCYVVAEVDGKVAGCCGFTNSFGEGNIDNVVVNAAYRGLGIAQEMLRKVLANPKKYAPSGVYIMRIHGTFVNFLDLSPAIQEDIIRRLDPKSTSFGC